MFLCLIPLLDLLTLTCAPFFFLLNISLFFLSNNNLKDSAEFFLTVRVFMCFLSLWFCLNASILLLLSTSMWICWFIQSTPGNTLANLYLLFEIIFITDFQKCNPVVRHHKTSCHRFDSASCKLVASCKLRSTKDSINKNVKIRETSDDWKY